MRISDKIKSLFQKKDELPQQQKPQQVRALLQEIAFSDPNRLFADGVMRYNPSILVSRKGLYIFDKMRQDDQIKAALNFKKHAVLSSGWEITSPEGENDSWEIRKFVEEMFDNLDGTLYEGLFEIMTALDYGYSISEKIFKEEKGKIVLKKIKTCKPHSFEFVSDEYGNLKELRQYKQDSSMIYSGGGGTLLPIEKFVVFSVNQEFGNHYGTSDLEAAYRPWLIKDNSYKWLAMMLERRGIPPLFALYDSNAYHPALVNQLKEVLSNIQAATVGAIPRNDKDSLEFYQPPTITDQKNLFVEVIEMFNKDIARAVLMPGLLGMTSDSKEGSYARAKVHFDVFMMVVQYLRSRLEDRVMFEQIIKPIVDLNFNTDIYPTFKFLPLTEDNMIELLNMWIEAIKVGGVKITAQDEAHLRDLLRFPEREEKELEKEYEEEKVQKQTPGSKEGEQPEEPETGQEEKGKEIIPPEEKKPIEKQEVDDSYSEDFEFGRDRNKFEHHVDFEHIDGRLTDIENKSKEQMIDILTDSRDALIRFTEKNRDGLMKLLGDLKIKGMGNVQSVIGEMLRVSYEFGYKEIKKELSGKKKEFEGLFTPTEALKYLSQKKLYIAGVMKESLLKDSKAVLMNALKTGELMTETREKLTKVFEPYVGNPNVLKNGKQIGARTLNTIIRTETTEAFNQGRVVAAKEVGKFLHGMEFSAILDERTTDICRGLDGKIFTMDDPLLSSMTPPLHWACRSVLVPVPKSIEVGEGDFASPTDVATAREMMEPSFGGTAAGKVKEAKATIEQIEGRIFEEYKKDGNEHSSFYSPSQRKSFFEKSGQEGSVDFSNQEVRKIREWASKYPDLTLIHNHPNGSSLSPQDLLFASEYGVKQVEAITEKYIHMAKTPTFTSEKMRREFFNEVSDAKVRHLKDYEKFYVDQNMTHAEAWAETSHLINKDIAEKFGYYYVRRVR